jgi:putative transposase
MGAMARPLRFDLIEGLYHVTARGIERREIFRDNHDRRHFLELLEQMAARFTVRLHAYVLMGNHYHLLVGTPRANLSAAMQWLGESYAGWFNRRHRRAGHLFQGRFKAIVLEEAAVWEVGCYLHLNPVRVRSLGLDKAARQRSRAGMMEPPAAEQAAERIRRLRGYRWSSYRAYLGWSAAPVWLDWQRVLALGGGRSWAERRQRYQQECEQAVREGRPESFWDRVEAGVVLGGQQFVSRLRRHLHSNSREHSRLRELQERVGFEAAVRVVEGLRGERWERFRDGYGDWGRDLVLYLGQQVCGLSLAELAQRVGVKYKTVATAIRRFKQRSNDDENLRMLMRRAERQLKNGET